MILGLIIGFYFNVFCFSLVRFIYINNYINNNINNNEDYLYN